MAEAARGRMVVMAATVATVPAVTWDVTVGLEMTERTEELGVTVGMEAMAGMVAPEAQAGRRQAWPK
ncbi:hypothetical protein [Pelagibacterium sp. H642]|uniref:hypothetical protein n=1 Tax=Pelagibacterium sp. H642 TaxID=1881069 RepID=UPI002815363E|nr:hypothetical protein [Pelagibacterium sp. H642]WMT92518.1 hypothetical protein NO934_16925 [Pelagibacterium sp. H642]